MAIVKTKDIYEDINLVDPSQSKIYVNRLINPQSIYYTGITEKDMYQVNYEKYQIKETDMRVKTATFKSNTYLDLTAGTYLIWIISPHHENFYGKIINVEYDTEDGKYEYQCQDYSRNFLWAIELVTPNVTVHHLMQYLLTRGSIPLAKNATNAQIKANKLALSGLRPAYQYESNLYDMVIKNWNVMTQHLGVIIRNKSPIQVIRDVIFGSGANIDLYFTSNGVLHLAPYNYKEWLNTGVHLTRSHVKEASFKIDVTNIVTGGVVNGSDLTGGKAYDSKGLLDIDLSQIFGLNEVSVNDPDAKKATSSSSSSSKTKTVKKAVMDKKTANIYNTKKKVVWLNSDRISNKKSTDRKRMEDMAKILKKNGWTVHIISEIGSEAHYRNRSKVKGGIWCTIYGAACAGTLEETASNSWFLNPLKKNHSRVVVCIFNKNNGILKGGKYYKKLPRAHDDGFSKSGYSGLKNPLKYMSNHGVPVMYATSVDKMVKKFLAGGDNYKDWKKHDVNWLGTKK